MKLGKVKIYYIHLFLAVTWVILMIPSLLWWKDSVLWVIVISIYANVAAHISGYSAAKAEAEARKNKDENK